MIELINPFFLFYFEMKKINFLFLFLFSPNGEQHFIHPDRDEFSKHHYSISSQNPKEDDPSSHNQSERNSTSVSASKVKWFDAVRTVKKLNQVRKRNF
jgi:hypothetical protein